MLKTAQFATFAVAASLAMTSLASADDFDKIKADGKIVVATEAAFPPFEFVENGEIIGFGADLLKEVTKDMGVGVEQLDLPFQGILAGLAAGQYDLVATSVAINEERSKTYAFTRPIAAIENAILVPVDTSDITDAASLEGKVVGTQLGSSTEAVAREIDEMLKKSGDGMSDLRLFQTFPDTGFALGAGQVDAILVSNTTAGEFMTKNPGKFKIAGTYGAPVLISWVVRPGNPKLLAQVNSTIDRLQSSGMLAEMQEKWVGTSMDLPTENYLPDGAVQ